MVVPASEPASLGTSQALIVELKGLPNPADNFPVDGAFLHAFSAEAQRSGLLHRKIICRVWRTLQLIGRAGSWLVLRDAGSRAGTTITPRLIQGSLNQSVLIGRLHCGHRNDFAALAVTPAKHKS